MNKEIEVYTRYGVYAGEWYEVDLHANIIGLTAHTTLDDMQRNYKIDIESIDAIGIMEEVKGIVFPCKSISIRRGT